MLLKILRIVWFLSVMALFATLLYNYAGWQEELILLEESSGTTFIGREMLFYMLVGVFALINVMVYLVGKMYPAATNFRAWFHGLMITINIFFIISTNFIGLYNSAEKFDYSRIGFIINGSVWLIVCMAVIWPLYLLYQKIFIKQVV